MHSIESVIIIPVIILLIIFFLMMVYFASGLSLFEINSSRYFMLSMTEKAHLGANDAKSDSSGMPTDHSTLINQQFFRSVFMYTDNETIQNPFRILNNKATFNFTSKYYSTKINRIGMAILKYSVDSFLNHKTH